jgi:hypothetical protein
MRQDIHAISRREFVRQSSAAVAAAGLWRVAARESAPRLLRIGWAGLTAAGADGARLGADEARHAAQLFGGAADIELLEASTSFRGAAVIAAGDCSPWLRLCETGRMLFVDAGCSDDTAHPCGALDFRVGPSRTMRAPATADAMVVAWSPSLSRFGADTLNQRFRARFGRGMTADAWQAWFAVKMLWESALRLKSSEPEGLAEFLVRPGNQFDGHKGAPLSIRASDHQLRQPLYTLSGDRVADELPRVSGDDSFREAFDRLFPPGEPTCAG